MFDVKDQLCAPTSPAITSPAYKLQKVETKDAPVSRRTLFGIENVSDDAALAKYRQLSKSAASMTVSYNNVTTTKDIGTNTQFFDDSADAELQEMVGLVPKVYSVLKEQGKLYHWIQFMRMTGQNHFPSDNIAYLLFLDVVEWYAAPSIRSMRYSDEVKLFWRLGQKLFHGRFLRFMSGFKVTDTTEETADHPYPNTVNSNINFAVPDRKMLTASASVLPSDIKPGILPTLAMLPHTGQPKSYKLCVDGKKINHSAYSKEGCINLFGFEEKPTAQELSDRLQEELAHISKVKTMIDLLDPTGETCVSTGHSGLATEALITSKIISNRLMDLRQAKVKKNLALEKFKGLGGPAWKSSKYMFVISAFHTLLHEINDTIDTAVELLDSSGQTVSQINGLSDTYVSGNKVLLNTQSNYVCLAGIQAILDDQKDALLEHSRFIQQRTDQWFRIRELGKVTGSTIYRAVGLANLKTQKEFFMSSSETSLRPNRVKQQRNGWIMAPRMKSMQLELSLAKSCLFCIPIWRSTRKGVMFLIIKMSLSVL